MWCLACVKWCLVMFMWCLACVKWCLVMFMWCLACVKWCLIVIIVKFTFMFGDVIKIVVYVCLFILKGSPSLFPCYVLQHDIMCIRHHIPPLNYTISVLEDVCTCFVCVYVRMLLSNRQ